MEDGKKSNFTQIPNVFFDTCDLPESAQLLYLRLFRQIGYRGNTFTGSIRKLAKLVHMSKSTVDRMVKRLEQSKLIDIERHDDRDTMTITIKQDDLWALNTHHFEVQPVPIWDTTLPDCPNLNQSCPNVGQNRPNLGQSVPPVSTKEGVIITNKTKKDKYISPFPDFCSERITMLAQQWDKFGNVEKHLAEAENIYQRAGIDGDSFFNTIFEAIRGMNGENIAEHEMMKRFFVHLCELLEVAI